MTAVTATNIGPRSSFPDMYFLFYNYNVRDYYGVLSLISVNCVTIDILMSHAPLHYDQCFRSRIACHMCVHWRVVKVVRPGKAY